MLYAVQEILPLLVGVVVGLVCAMVSHLMARRVLWLVLSVAGGAAASWINGEMAAGYEFLIFDIPFVALVALAVMLAMRRLQRSAPVF